MELSENDPLAESRGRLARHVLLTDLITSFGDAIPQSLDSVTVASEPSAIDACVGLARTWRLRRDVRESYVAASQRVEQSLAPLSFVIGPSLLETKDNGPRTKDQGPRTKDNGLPRNLPCH